MKHLTEKVFFKGNLFEWNGAEGKSQKFKENMIYRLKLF